MSKPSADLNEVLFIRADVALLSALDREVARRRKLAPGETISRASVVRSMLWMMLGQLGSDVPREAA